MSALATSLVREAGFAVNTAPWKTPVAFAFEVTTKPLDVYREDGFEVAAHLVTIGALHLTHLATLMVLEGLPRNFLFLGAVLEQDEGKKLHGPWIFLGATFPEDWEQPIWRNVLLAQLPTAVPPTHHERFLAHVMQAAHACRSSYPPPPAYGESCEQG